ncbi:class I SAM-dependent methyltransferase [Luteimonas fraxinea]|uniref:class I SAM-dependent methyltransferase n=1 Tax=Luteimonas fraxinea TaxID=2901869 RepID=UPI001E56E3C1|nr:class I SAM-dependent methyltransferase [Luteimonas fraxinea]MCD9124384.1 class I SAM-dependent methyltransferase [Luteimonas fraxinea]
MSALEVIGSDVDRFKCPRCFSHDRERHLYLYLAAAGIYERIPEADLLHFAPERHLSRKFASQAPKRYVRCDLHPNAEGIDAVDICAMPFGDQSFDLLVANHVLEHVHDDGRALAEVHRVLRPGGFAILQTPFSRKLQVTWEDDGISDDWSRTQAYGQEDHVRLYGRDFFSRVAAAGFLNRCSVHKQLLGSIDPVRFGVNADEPFMLFERV